MGQYNRDCYWKSILLRGDAPSWAKKPEENSEYWETARLSEGVDFEQARNDNVAVALNDEYEVYNIKADETVIIRMPEELIPVIDECRNTLLRDIKEKGFVIETCPTSNLMIGPFDRYDQLPLLNLVDKNDLDNSIQASVNTDTKGVFATSLYDEFSLIALSMKKKGCDMSQVVIPYIQKLMENNREQKFEPIKIES